MNLTVALFCFLLFLTITLWAVVDIYLIYTFGASHSFSNQIYWLSVKYPIVPFLIGLAIGIIVGHIFWERI